VRPILVAWAAARLGPVVGEVVVPDYGTLLALAFILSGALTLRIGLRHGLPMRRGMLALIAVYVGALLGARAFTVLSRVPLAVATGERSALFGGGLTAYGGFLGGALAGYLSLRRGDFLPLADAASPALGLGTAVTRLGCLLGGCDFGAVTDVPWAVRYPAGSLAYLSHAGLGWLGPYSTESLAVHPTPLYEAGLGLLLCIVALFRLRQRGTVPLDGRVFVGTAAGYAVGRFCIEFLRGDSDRGIFWGGLSTSQLTSLVVLLLVCHHVARRHRPAAVYPTAMQSA
jgi:phosphatidylglycerol:prolipoprotein diacylglycerol transferase